jgi:copper chaperone CopZ
VKFETPQDNTLVVTYDTEKTTTAKIKQALKKGGFAPTVKPVSPH